MGTPRARNGGAGDKLPRVSAIPGEGVILSEFWQKARALARETFLKEFPAPFLVEVAGPVAVENLDFKTFHGETTFARAGETPSSGLDATTRIRTVAKRGTLFPGKITVGRSGNNDVVVLNPRVSKLQAYFTVENGTYGLVDAESSNGTFLNGEKLKALVRHPVRDTDVIGFGTQTRFLFWTAERLHEKTKGLLGGGRRP